MILGLIAVGAGPFAFGGQDFKSVRVDVGPRIDGRLDDPAWKAAHVIDGFRMVEPRPGEDPSEKTEAWIVYDGQNLYIGVYCHDSEPSRISANSMAHDSGGDSGGPMGYGYGHVSSTSSDDIVRVLLDPFQDKRNAYVFFVNPRGARGEGLVYAGSASLNWDGIWEAESSRLADGWSAEIRIPFKTISFRPGLSVWGLNIERTIARKMETIRLSGTTLDSNFNNPNEAATLQGIEGVKQGLGITFRPYGLASAARDNHVSNRYRGESDGGFDLYKSFTPNLVGVVSYNIDFAETEVDERRINLTRFPLFFPEKRMFFLEGSENFSFSSSISFTPFFSRTVGLYQGSQIPVLFGTKLYGKIGNTNVTFLDVQTRASAVPDPATGGSRELPGRNLLAARLTQNIFAQSKIGWIFTNGSQTGERNSLAGMDFNYSSSRFLGDKNIMLAAWGVYNWNETPEGRHHGFGFRANYPNDLWNIQTTYAYYGEALNPGLGYMMRQGIQTGFIMVGFQPRPKGGFLGSFVRQFYFNTSADYYWDLSGHLATSTVSASPISFRTQSGETLGFSVVANRDVLPYDWTVSEDPGIVL
ncbi:MAG TPA: carbohydrate binding family 9 domain-containing protein, partial [Acidobacteriota bacterium]|nr:carbohydrate binding family 9 domain-containing protein [Acidobacteriota bacterium]